MPTLIPGTLRVPISIACCLLSGTMLAAGCGEPTNPRATPLDQVSFIIVHGDAQNGEVGSELADPLIIQALTAGGLPFPGLVVNFNPLSGDGTMYGGSAITDEEGQAEDYWTLGTVAGIQTLEVRAVDATSGEKVVLGTFTATAAAGPAVELVPKTGDNQAGPAGSFLGAATRILVVDKYGNPVSDVKVSFAVASGGGSLEAPTSATTQAAGLAKAGRWKLGSSTGLNTLRATVPGLSPVTFAARSLAGLGVGSNFGCGLTAGGAAHCWGDNTFGELGDGGNTARWHPGLVAGGLSFASLTTFDDHSCGLTASGQAYCWGYNFYGELGDGTKNSRSVPTAVASGLTFVALAAGAGHTCGLVPSGAAYCWGHNASGQLGDGTKADRLTPKAVTGGLNFTALSAGNSSTCGLDTTGRPYCWGRNLDGELSDGTKVNRARPVLVDGGLHLTTIISGGQHACGLTSEGVAWCWGLNNSGQLGAATVLDPTPPVAVSGGFLFTSLAAGGYHSCGITTTGLNKCWGWNGSGQLGNGATSESQSTPTTVAGGVNFAALAAGLRSSCGLTAEGAAYCWGENEQGQLGDGTTVDRLLPAPVLGSVTFLDAPAARHDPRQAN